MALFLYSQHSRPYQLDLNGITSRAIGFNRPATVLEAIEG